MGEDGCQWTIDLLEERGLRLAVGVTCTLRISNQIISPRNSDRQVCSQHTKVDDQRQVATGGSNAVSLVANAKVLRW